MDSLHFGRDSFQPSTSIARLGEDLFKIIGQEIYYDTSKIQNKEWLWLVKNIVAVMKSDTYYVAVLEHIRAL